MSSVHSPFGKVAVLMGGASAEREISLLSGRAVLEALRSKGVDAHAFDPALQSPFNLVREGFTRCFIALHGRGGEDGSLQGALELMGVPYTGSGVMASALAMDKVRTKLLWQSVGVPTARFARVTAKSDFEAIARDLGYPLIVKPVHEGSSLGISKVSIRSEFEQAVNDALRLDPQVMVEQFVQGVELTAAILGARTLPLVRIEAPEGKYDYQNKYFTDVVKYHCPSGVTPDIEAKIQADALRAFESLGCAGWGRADVILQPDGRYSFLEMNTSPGMTGHSLVPIAAKQAGLAFADLCLAVLQGCRFPSQRNAIEVSHVA